MGESNEFTSSQRESLDSFMGKIREDGEKRRKDDRSDNRIVFLALFGALLLASCLIWFAYSFGKDNRALVRQENALVRDVVVPKYGTCSRMDLTLMYHSNVAALKSCGVVYNMHPGFGDGFYGRFIVIMSEMESILIESCGNSVMKGGATDD